MSGTHAGGVKAAKTNKIKHGDNFYAEIGRKGGHNGTTGGFASDKVGKDGLTGWERATKVGAIGGKKSKRGKAKAPHVDEEEVKEKGGWTWPFSRKGK